MYKDAENNEAAGQNEVLADEDKKDQNLIEPQWSHFAFVDDVHKIPETNRISIESNNISKTEPLSKKESFNEPITSKRECHGCHGDQYELFGWRNFRPKFLQRLNSPVAMLVFICLLVAVQAKLVSGFLNTSLSTIEKVFGLSSTKSGLLISTYDVASLLAVIPVTYFGQAGRKPRYLGGGALLIATGCLTFFLPETTRDPYTWLTDDELQYCSNTLKDQDCGNQKSNQNLRFIFMVGTLLIGVGATPVYTLGVAYMDENVPRDKSALYLGVFYTVAVAAPALGYILSGVFLRIPIDFKHWTVDIEDPSWAGAWFIGFLLQALLAILVAIPLLGLPKRIKGAAEIERTVEAAVTAEKEKTSPGFKDFKKALRTLPVSLLVLFKNYTFMFLIGHGVCAYLIISGLATFLPKFFESQFGLSSSNSALIVGSLAIPAAAVGTLGSGLFLKYKNWPCKKVMKFTFVIQCASLPFLAFFLFACPKFGLVGLNVSHDSSSIVAKNGFSFDFGCNKNCHCDYIYFDPICAPNGITYFSPCHAGCSNEKLDDCSCLHNTTAASQPVATRETCEEDCSIKKLSYTLFFFMSLVCSMISVPHITCLLRVVSDSQRSLALAVQWVFVRLLGTIPGPIIVGKIFDITCLLWNESKACHSDGFCLNYDSTVLGYYVFVFALVTVVCGGGFLLAAIKLYEPQPLDSHIVVVKIQGMHSGSEPNPYLIKNKSLLSLANQEPISIETEVVTRATVPPNIEMNRNTVGDFQKQDSLT